MFRFGKYLCTIVIITIASSVYGQQGDNTRLSESKYYQLCKKAIAEIDATTDSIDIELAWMKADSLTFGYIYDWPNKPQGYAMRVSAAKKADRDTTKGLAVEPIQMYMQYLAVAKDTSDVYRQIALANLYYLFIYNFQYDKKTSKSEIFRKAIVILKQMLQLCPDPDDKYALQAKSLLHILDPNHRYSISVGPPEKTN